MAYSLGSAYIQVVPNMKGFGKALGKELDGAAASASGKGGGSLGGKIFGGLKKSALGAGVAIGGVLGTSIVKGFNRLSSIEQAEAKLTGLGHSAESVSKVMDNALASVKGTAYGLDEAASLAGTLVASGIKPGQELEKTLKLTADSATIAGRELGDMGLIWGSVAAKGKLQGDDAFQLLASGVPIWQMVGDVMGKTAAEAQELGSKGKVSFDIFQKAMEQGVGGAALSAGDTTVGAFKNVNAALGRFGAEILSGIFPLIGPGFKSITAGIDVATAAVGPWMDRMTLGIQGVWDMLSKGDFTSAFREAFGVEEDSPIVGTLLGIRDTAITVFDEVKNRLGGLDLTPVAAAIAPIWEGFKALAPVLAQAWANLSPLKLAFDVLAPVLPTIGQAIGTLAGTLGGVLTSALAVVIPLVSQFVGAMGPIVAEFVSHVIPAVLQVADSVGKMLIPTFQQAAPILSTVMSGLMTAVGGIMGVLGPVITALGQFISFIMPAAPVLIGLAGAVFLLNKAFLLHRAVLMTMYVGQRTYAAALLLTTTGVIRQRIATVASTVAQKAAAVWTRTVAIAQWAWNAALSANPIGLVIAAVAALVAGLVYFFTQTETGQKVWAVVWGAIKASAQAVADWFMNTLVPWFKSAWDQIAAGAVWLYQNAILPVWNGIKTAINAVATWVMGTLVPWFQSAWQAIGSAAQWLYTSIIQPVWNGIKTAIVVVIAIVMTYIDMWVAIYRNVLAPVFTWLLNSVIMPVWNGIKSAINGVVAWFQNTAWPIISVVIGWITTYFENMKTGLGIIWEAVKAAINVVVQWFQNTAWPVIQSVIDWIKNAFDVMKGALQTAWDAVKNAVNTVVTWLRDTAKAIIKAVVDFIIGYFEFWRDKIQAVWNFVKDNVINPVVQWFQNTVAPLIQRVIEFVVAYFQQMRDDIAAVWNFIKDNIIQPVVSWFENTIKPKFDNIVDGIKSAFDTLKDGVKAAFDGIQDAAKAPVRFVVETVVNGGLIDNFNKVAKKFGVAELPTVALPSGFSSGGYTGRGSKYQPAGIVHADEFVIRKESQKQIEAHAPGLLASMNRNGASALAGRVPGYAGGGFVGKAWNGIKQAGGDVLDKVMEGFDFVAEAMADPKGAFKKILDGFAGTVPGGGYIRDLALSVPPKMIDMLADVLLPSGDGGGGGGGKVAQNGASGVGWTRASQAAASLGLTMTSGTRRGARTAGSGSVSLHAMGRARDYAGSASAMSAFFDAMDKAPYPTELLYSPKGGRNIHRGGGRYANTGKTKSNHYNHVHVGFSEGGWTGPGSKYTPAGVVHADEFVMQKSARRSIEAKAPGLLDRLNALGAGALSGYARGGLVGYASGGTVSGSGKVGKVNVADVLTGLLGTPKQVRSAADKLAAQVTSAFKAKASTSKKTTVNSLSDQLDALKGKAKALTKTSKETVKVTSKIGGKKRTQNVATAAAKAASAELAGVNASIAKTQDALKKARRGDTSGAATAKALGYEAKNLAGGTAALESFAVSREKLTARIKSATEALNEAVKVRNDYAISMTDKLASFAFSADSGNFNIVTLTEQFKKSTLGIQSFGKQITALRKRGLSDGLVDQVAQLGAVDGGKLAGNLLKGTKAQTDRLNAWFNAQNKYSASVAGKMANEMYGAGVDGARGLVNGLNSQLAAVNGAAKKVAGSLVKTVKKTLKIHSPSRVFREIGGFTSEGMALGILDGESGVQSAMTRIAEPPRVDTSFVNASAGADMMNGGKAELSDESIDRLADAFAQVKLVMDRRELASAVRSSQALSVRTGARV